MNQETGTTNSGEVNSTAKKELTGKEKRQLNLKPFDSLSQERQKEIRSMGGKACQEKIKQRKTMQEQLLAFLDTKADRETAEKYLGPDANKIPDAELTLQAIMTARMWQEATEKGNARAAEFVRDTSGQKIKEQIQITADTMTDADRSLMANIAERLGLKTD